MVLKEFAKESFEFESIDINMGPLRWRTRYEPIPSSVLITSTDPVEIEFLKELKPILFTSPSLLITNYYVEEINCISEFDTNMNDWNYPIVLPNNMHDAVVNTYCIYEISLKISDYIIGDNLKQCIDEVKQRIDNIDNFTLAELVTVIMKTDQSPKHARTILKILNEMKNNDSN